MAKREMSISQILLTLKNYLPILVYYFTHKIKIIVYLKKANLLKKTDTCQ